MPLHSFDAAWEVLEQRREHRERAPTAYPGTQFLTLFRDEDEDGASRWVAQATKGAAYDWCEQHHLRKYSSFTVRHFGRAESSTLALQWCSKMQFFFDLWMSQRKRDYVYTEEDLESYQPGDGWNVFLQGLPADSPARERAEALVQMQLKL